MKILLGVFINIAFSCNVYGYKAKVNGDSMEPLLRDKEVVEVLKGAHLKKDLEHDDLVLFKMSTHKNLIVKMVKAIPKDLVEFKENNIYINSKKIVNSKSIALSLNSKQQKIIKNKLKDNRLKKNQYLVFSDNLDNVFDSKSFGPIFKFQIIGKVIKRKTQR